MKTYSILKNSITENSDDYMKLHTISGIVERAYVTSRISRVEWEKLVRLMIGYGLYSI